MATQRLLEIHNATAYQGDTCVFENLSLSIDQGDNVAILGPNGAGKSTLLKLLTRDIYPVVKENSYVKINGCETVNVNQLREQIGLVSHDLQAKYTACATGLDVVMSGFFGAVGMIYSHFKTNDEQIDQARKSIADLGLSALEGRMYHHLSTGQQRRFLLARAMIHTPKTLILDEPTNSLDIHATFQLIDHLRKLTSKGTAIVLATHHIQEIIPEIERVVLIKKGQVIADGNKTALLTDEVLSELYDTPVHVVEKNGFYQAFPG